MVMFLCLVKAQIQFKFCGFWILSASFICIGLIIWFDIYRACDEGSVMLANHEEYNVMGIGTVTLKMFDGILKILGNVRDVPEIGFYGPTL